MMLKGGVFEKRRDAHTLSKLSGVKLVTVDGEERISFPTKNRKDTDAGINLYHEIQNVPGLLEYNTTESCSIAYDEELQEEYILANPAAIDEVSAETLIKEREEERLEPGITVRGEGEGVIGIQVLDFEICQEMKDEVDDKLVSEQGTPKSIDNKFIKCGTGNSDAYTCP